MRIKRLQTFKESDSINRRMAAVIDRPIGPRLKSGLFVQWRKAVPLFLNFGIYSAAGNRLIDSPSNKASVSNGHTATILPFNREIARRIALNAALEQLADMAELLDRIKAADAFRIQRRN